MMLSEFLENSNSRDNEFNRKLFNDYLEPLYMDNDYITKEMIYKAGKILHDNRPSEVQQRQVEAHQKEIDRLLAFCEVAKNTCYYGDYKAIQAQRKHDIEEIQKASREIKFHKECIASIMAI